MTKEEARKILGLRSVICSESELAKAYRAKVRAFHPDVHGDGTTEQLRDINIARDTLLEAVEGRFGLVGRETWAELRGLRHPDASPKWRPTQEIGTDPIDS